MQENNDKNQGKNGLSFESLDILIAKWKDGTFSEIIDDWKWIFSYSVRYKWAIVFYTILGIFSTSMGLVSSVAGKYLIDIITGYKTNKLMILIIVMVGSSLFSLLFSSIISRISTKLSIYINNDIQADIFDKIVDADWLEINKYSNGDVLNRFNGDIGTVSSNAISWLPTIVIAIYNFIATFLVILHYNAVMAILALASAPFMLLMSRFMIKKQREYSQKTREMSSKLMTFEVEAFYNFDTIKSFGIAPHYSRLMRWWQGKFKDVSLEYNMFSIKTNILLSVMGTGVEFIAFGYCLFLLWTHTITYGTMTLFLQQRSNLSGAFNNVVSIIPSFLNSSVSAHRIRELVELPKEVHISESEELDPFAEDGFEVLMKDVNFAYVEGTRVITDSYFKACPGEIVALVGPSGEGKTTMIRLILGLIRPQEGEAVIVASNGREIVLNAETRHFFAYVPQGNTILSGTIAENMRMVKEDATDGENSLLIGSGRMRALIKALKSKYDIIILDTAPSELLADAPLLGKYVDAALYVIRYDYTKLREIREGVESLALSGIDMLGYVFNGDNSSGGQGYGYGYRRYGNYGSYGSHYGSYGKYGAYGHYGKMEKGSTDKFGRVIKD